MPETIYLCCAIVGAPSWSASLCWAFWALAIIMNPPPIMMSTMRRHDATATRFARGWFVGVLDLPQPRAALTFFDCRLSATKNLHFDPLQALSSAGARRRGFVPDRRPDASLPGSGADGPSA